MCLKGARWVEDEFLDKNPELKIRVYAIWLPIMAGDTRDAFPDAKKVLHDSRVENFWDEEKEVGRWFKENITPEYSGPAQWDAFYLYDAGAEWKDKPGPWVAYSRPIFPNHEKLSEGIARLGKKDSKVGTQDSEVKSQQAEEPKESDLLFEGAEAK